MISIIVLSSDGYKDCWDPLFQLFLKYFPEIKKNEVLLSTNHNDYTHDGIDIKVLKHGNVPWSLRLKKSLEFATNDIVLVLVEDFVLRSSVDNNILESFVLRMQNEPSIDHIRLLSTMEKTKVKPSAFPNLDKIEQNAKLRYLYLPGLWKKEVLNSYLVDFESPFMSERMGDLKSKIMNHGFYAVSYDFVKSRGQFYDCPTSGTIFKGKWANWVPEFFNRENISMDFDIRGFTTKEFRRKTRVRSKFQLLITPISTIKSFLSYFNIYFKELFKN